MLSPTSGEQHYSDYNYVICVTASVPCLCKYSLAYMLQVNTIEIEGLPTRVAILGEAIRLFLVLQVITAASYSLITPLIWKQFSMDI